LGGAPGKNSQTLGGPGVKNFFRGKKGAKEFFFSKGVKGAPFFKNPRKGGPGGPFFFFYFIVLGEGIKQKKPPNFPQKKRQNFVFFGVEVAS